MLPAWSEPFLRERLPELTRRRPFETAAPAWFGSKGEGVTVAIVDSGVEGDHPAKTIGYATYDFVRVLNRGLDALGLRGSLVERAQRHCGSKPKLAKCSTRRGAISRPSTPGVSSTKRRAALAIVSCRASADRLSRSIAAKDLSFK